MIRDLSRLNVGLAYQKWRQKRQNAKRALLAEQAFLAYQKNTTEPKIQFGCGANKLHGWLNTDANPKNSEVFVDIAKPLPFKSNCFDFAFSEHVFGYLNFTQAEEHLKEVNRVLKPGGVYQIQTPNLDLIFDANHQTESYYAWYLEKFKVPNNAAEAVFFLNHFMKIAYGTYFHNKKSLGFLAEKTQWTTFKKVDDNNISIHKSLQNLSYHSKVIGESHNRLETLVVEFTK